MLRLLSRRNRSFRQEILLWLVSLTIAIPVMVLFVVKIGVVEATVTNIGVAFFGDNSATGQGNVRVRDLTSSPTTWGAQFDGATASTTSFANWIVAKSAPTREETMIGIQRVNGTLDIQTCTTACDANADFTNRWNNPGTSATQTCSVSTAGGCSRPFDIDYLGLNGKALVAYGDSVAAKFYYALWDGTAWSPNTTPGTPGVTNQVLTNSGGPTCAGTPRWIRVVATGENLADDRSNRAMVMMADTNDDLCVFYWDGTAFDAGTTLTSTLGNCGSGQCFDGNWQGNNTFVINYTNSGVAEVRYRTYVVGTGWGADTQAYTTATTPIFLTSVADPTSSRIFVESVSSGNDTRNVVWRGDNATNGWTVCSNGGTCPDTAIETVGGNQAYPAFERFNGSGVIIYNDAGTTADSSYWRYTAPSTWTATARTTLTTTDDALMTKAWGSPNSTDIMTISEDVDCKIYAMIWQPSAWNATVTNLNNGTTATVTNYSATCPLSTAPGVAPIGIAYDYDYVWKMYSPWQRNWRFFDGADTANTPTTGLAAENTAVSLFEFDKSFRLRINYAELAKGVSSVDERKKLQFTMGCNPNSVLAASCTWFDVDQSGGSTIWRYKSPGACASCSDGTLLAGTTLTGTNATCTAGNGCGTWVNDGIAAAGANMDHNLNIIQESEWDVEPNSTNLPAYSTTYYFRIWNKAQATPIYTEADVSTCQPSGTSACTYPSLTTQAAPNLTQAHYRWINDNGSETTATNNQNEDIATTGIVKSTNIRLRYLVRNSGGRAFTKNYRLAFATVSGTCDTGLVGETYTDVPTSAGSAFQMTSTANYTDQAASTNVAGRLTDPAGTFNAGKLVSNTSNQASNVTLPDGSVTGQFTELEYNFQATTNATDGGQYCFILRDTTTNLNTYSVVGDLTVVPATGPTTDQVLRHGNWWNAGSEQSFFWAN